MLYIWGSGTLNKSWIYSL